VPGQASNASARRILVIAAILGSAVVTLGVGWVLGMWTRKRANLWCPVDGTKLTCSRCATTAVHSLGGQANRRRRLSTVEGAA
jgi:hypothetical protein